MKRDETVLKKAVEENSKIKKELHSKKKAATSPRFSAGGGNNRFSGNYGAVAARPSPRSRKKEQQ